MFISYCLSLLLECMLHKSKNLFFFSLIHPKGLELCLAHCGGSNNICRVNEWNLIIIIFKNKFEQWWKKCLWLLASSLILLLMHLPNLWQNFNRSKWSLHLKINEMVKTIFFSVDKLCLTLCNPMNCSIPDSCIFHYFLEFAQIHVHWVGDVL